jgi:hypothetical protein
MVEYFIFGHDIFTPVRKTKDEFWDRAGQELEPENVLLAANEKAFKETVLPFTTNVFS